ncbi:MAG: hypothetical protein U1F43_36885 [Myxococcota bacterium]
MLVALTLLLASLPLPMPHAAAALRSQARSAPRAAAGISMEEALSPVELVRGGGWSIAVVTVVDAPRRAGSNAEPPRLAISVDAVLGGQLPTGAARAVWAGRLSDIDWSGPSAVVARRRWAAERVEAPAIGARFIALAAMRDGAVELGQRLREPYSAAAEARWRELLAAPRPAPEVAPPSPPIPQTELATLVRGAEVIAVATLSTLQFDGHGQWVTVHASETLRGAPGVAGTIILATDAERRGYVEGAPVVIFAAHRSWPSPFGGDFDGWRPVDASAIRLATPETLTALRSLLP